MNRSIALTLILCLFSIAGFAQQWQAFTTENSGLPSNHVFSVDVDASGILWFGTDSGVTAFDGSKWYSYSRSYGLADNQVNDLKIMEPAELWAGTDNGVSAIGFSSLDAVTMATPYRTNNTGLLSNKINSVAIDQSQIRWFGTDSGVTAFTGQNWISAGSPRVVLENDVMTIDIGPDLIAYCGTAGGGVARLKLSDFDIITGASTMERPWAPVPIDSVYAIHIGADGLQWFGTTQGLFQHRGVNSKINWKRFTVSDGLPHPHVQAITEDSVGKIWVATRRGIAQIEKDLSAYVNYSSRDGLINDDVRDIVIAADGSIWLATAGGVSRFSSNTSMVQNDNVGPMPEFIELYVYPNPFNHATAIEFRWKNLAPAEIAIYNLLGQRVRRLWDGLVSTNRLLLHWDGRDDQGCPVPSGLYLARCSSGLQVVNKKMVLIK